MMKQHLVSWCALLVCLGAASLGCGTPGERKPPDPLTVGRKIYYTRCATCHQADGKGIRFGKPFAADLSDPAGVMAKSDAQLVQSVLDGLEGPLGRMQPFKPILSNEEALNVVAFIRETHVKKSEDQQ